MPLASAPPLVAKGESLVTVTAAGVQASDTVTDKPDTTVAQMPWSVGKLIFWFGPLVKVGTVLSSTIMSTR